MWAGAGSQLHPSNDLIPAQVDLAASDPMPLRYSLPMTLTAAVSDDKTIGSINAALLWRQTILAEVLTKGYKSGCVPLCRGGVAVLPFLPSTPSNQEGGGVQRRQNAPSPSKSQN